VSDKEDSQYERMREYEKFKDYAKRMIEAQQA